MFSKNRKEKRNVDIDILYLGDFICSVVREFSISLVLSCQCLAPDESEEGLRELGVMRLRGDLVPLCNCLTGGVQPLLPKNSDRKEETASSCTRGGLDRILEKISSPAGL